MKPVAMCLAALLLVACASTEKAPTQGKSTVSAAKSPGTASRISVISQPKNGKGVVQLNGDVYTADLPAGPESWFSAVATGHGILWSSPQRKTGDGLYTHPIASARLYISPFQNGGGDLSGGAKELFTFPLSIPTDAGMDQFISIVQIADAGEWAGILISLRVPGNNQGLFRLDAVNLQTREHRIITDRYLSGGMQFMWRTEPGLVYWEQQSLSPTGEPLLLASKSIDLSTGRTSDVPPGTAKQK